MSEEISWPLAYNIIRGRAFNSTFGMVRHEKDGRPMCMP